ncbi:hypothetical protein [Spirosoma spitsbergense]|uniref:hypothetical protein n=1 Tax=Spirosoma spitsbergense TaxID=431554 RepID=UPI000382AE4D|nr:hypothetical protein [Spirosoma spitsbergense]
METYKQMSAPSAIPKQVRWLWWSVLLALIGWVLTDLYVPRKNSIRHFDPAEVARLETAMWQSYYDKRPVLLFWQLAGGLRQQFHAPFWRSFVLAFQATKAAFMFKQGKSRADYQETLPDLVAYYESIQALTVEQFNVPRVAELELEWWIVHRQRDRYSYNDLANALVQTSAALYNQPAGGFAAYGPLRADAMRLCDEAGRQDGGGTEADWQQINIVLNKAWGTLQVVVQNGR